MPPPPPAAGPPPPPGAAFLTPAAAVLGPGPPGLPAPEVFEATVLLRGRRALPRACASSAPPPAPPPPVPAHASPEMIGVPPSPPVFPESVLLTTVVVPVES